MQRAPTLRLVAHVAAAAAIAVSVRAQETTKPLEVLVTLERTACFGTCPDYTVTIDGAGKVVYEGRRFVRVTGRQISQIDPLEVAKLVTEFQRAGFFEMKDEYTANITDQPTQFVGLTQGGRSKRIRDYFDAPKALTELETRVDAVADTRRWVYVDPRTVADLRAAGKRLPDGEDIKQLSLASQRGDTDVVRALLLAGADPNAQPPEGQRPLFGARSAAIVRVLIENGADVNLVIRPGTTPLMFHAQWSEPAIVELLLHAGALVNAADAYGQTPLIAAAMGGNPATVGFLLAAGADVSRADQSGHSALYYAEAGLRDDEELSKQPNPFREPKLEDRRRALALLRARSKR